MLEFLISKLLLFTYALLYVQFKEYFVILVYWKDPYFCLFRGSYLVRRMKEREKEIEEDMLDRQREKEELDELRKKLVEEGHPDPEAEVERVSYFIWQFQYLILCLISNCQFANIIPNFEL